MVLACLRLIVQLSLCFSLSVMSGVSRLSTQDITDTSVALVWTPPPVQYETYYITFTSQVRSRLNVKVFEFHFSTSSVVLWQTCTDSSIRSPELNQFN